MKKLLSIVICTDSAVPENAYGEETEILLCGGKTLYETVKKASGKYCMPVDTDFSFGEIKEFLTFLDGAKDDVIVFNGGYCFKTSLLRGLNAKQGADRFGAEIFAAYDAKTVAKTELKPFLFTAVHTEYSEKTAETLSESVEEFKKNKSKLPREVYSFVFDMICNRLIIFYISAMIAIKKKKLDAQSLKDFDAKLKDNVVLYLALEKRFTAASLKKLREKDFKIGLLTYNKFKKCVKK